MTHDTPFLPLIDRFTVYTLFLPFLLVPSPFHGKRRFTLFPTDRC
jgi:hypothetical protein